MWKQHMQVRFMLWKRHTESVSKQESDTDEHAQALLNEERQSGGLADEAAALVSPGLQGLIGLRRRIDGMSESQEAMQGELASVAAKLDMLLTKLGDT